MTNAKRPIIIVDGLNIFLRHFLVNESMSSKSEPVGGIVGMVRFLDNLVERWSPSKVIVVWENGGPSPRRRSLCKTYKANRSKSKGKSFKDNLRTDTKSKIDQLSLLYKLLKKTPICQIFIENTECDDIIGYLAKYIYNDVDALKLIVSGDKDFYQLLDDDNVKIYDPARKITIDGEWVREKFDISARNFCLARTFVGDPSDNLEGVPGVGLKTLSKRFPFLNDVDVDASITDVLDAARELLNTKAGKKLKAPKEILECEDLIRRNWKLMYLSTSNLAAMQISKIQGTLDNHEPKMDKFGFIKEIVSNGIIMPFNYDKFTTNLKQNLIFD